MSPFKALYGYEPPTILDFVLQEAKCPAAEEALEEAQRITKILRDNLSTSINRMKQQANKNRSERSFQEGDMVFVRLQPYKQTSLKKDIQAKLQPKYFGPYKIIRRIGEVAYELQLPEQSKIHNVFHVSILKKQVGDKVVTQTNMPTIDEEGRTILKPERIIETQIRNLRNKRIKRYKVKWEDLPKEEATWETEEFIQQFPDLTP